MALDIWFKDDIANIIRAANEANFSALALSEASIAGTSGEDGEEEAALRRAYRQGFLSALTTLSLALGLPAPTKEPEGLAAARLQTQKSDRGLVQIRAPAIQVRGETWVD